jgi:hypothetical protein
MSTIPAMSIWAVSDVKVQAVGASGVDPDSRASACSRRTRGSSSFFRFASYMESLFNCPGGDRGKANITGKWPNAQLIQRDCRSIP